MVDVRLLRRPVATLLLVAFAGAVPAIAQTEPRAGAAPPPQRPPVDDLYDKSLEAAVEAIKVYGLWQDAGQLRRVADIGYRIAQESGYREYPLTFALIDMAEPNAFALPAGQIFVTRGMLSLGLTDDQLAALLGHEIAHVVHRHGVRMERRATLLNVLTQAVLLGVAIGADNDDRRYDPTHPPDPWGRDRDPSSGDLIYGSYAASLILSELLLRSYSREFEDESDDDGQRWAAAAGFAPDGAAQLMSVLGSRLPESRDYGYWRTHPFFLQRVGAARARSRELVRGVEKPTAEFRSWSQRKVLDLGSRQPPESDAALLVERVALSAWPRGAEADRLRLERIHRSRKATLDRDAMSRDYGALLAEYDREIEEVTALEPTSALLTKLGAEREALTIENRDLYAQAQSTWKGGVYQTPFLEAFLSNWPAAGEVPEVALALGEAYGRTSRQADAVAMFLRAAAANPTSDAGRRAMTGLRTIAPALDQLTALAELAAQDRDPEVARVASERLATLATTYTDIGAGADYLQRFPEGAHVDLVAARLDVLAENLYGEVLLYQSVGDHVRAIDRIQKILTHAPASPAAQKLLERVVLPS